MREFEYTITDPLGIHARPAGLLVKAAKQYHANVLICKGEKSADATRLLAVMGLGIKQGDRIRMTVTGEDEATAVRDLEVFCRENF